MKSYWIQAVGNKTEIELRDTPVPVAGPGQVLVRMCATAFNRGELIVGGLTKAGVAKAAGAEGAGEVEALGEGVTGFKVGDRVMGRCGGAFAEYALMDAREAVPVPANLSWEEAASVPLVFQVAQEMLITQGHLKAGQWLLVTGISAGVGVASLQIAKALGAKVIGTSGSPAKLERLKAMGLDAGINTRGPDFHKAVLEATGGKGANLVVNNVGGSVFAECVRSMAHEGRMATVGYVDQTMTGEIDIEALHVKRLVLFGVSNKKHSAEGKAANVRAFVADVLPLIADGRIKPLVDKVFSFAELPAAKAAMESNVHMGKIVVRIA